MKRLLPISAALLLLAVPVWGQDGDPKVEVFGGFSFGEIEVDQQRFDGSSGFDYETTKGFQAAVTVTVNRTLGFVTDFGGLWGDIPFTPFKFGGSSEGTFTMFQIFAGPRFTKHEDGFTVFVHALPGFARQLATVQRTFLLRGVDPTTFTTTSKSTHFAMALGGGVDVNLGKRLAIRALQIDYLPPQVFRKFGSSVRFGVGVVLKFGE